MPSRLHRRSPGSAHTGPHLPLTCTRRYQAHPTNPDESPATTKHESSTPQNRRKQAAAHHPLDTRTVGDTPGKRGHAMSSTSYEQERTEPGTPHTPGRKRASARELEQRLAELEVQLALAQPDQALRATRELKKAHLRIRNLRYHLDQIERSVTRLCARIPESELVSLRQYCRETLEKEPATDEGETTQENQHTAMQARLILDQEAENTPLREQNAELESERDQAQADLARLCQPGKPRGRKKETTRSGPQPLELWDQGSA